ncbi:DUF4174 domain-containing protein [Psychromarinibacter halotolerans]|uniref:DUF4174 domain-containing protein n=1 Tax=Psychromarinibacter halotolerans TaxID=1775175 RepID=A0ABV7GME1_9RHOB|nr:DUF4174 domain-containing protein [Psychromarinibacter halotolerans]MDF0597092.1 DUF4174 domain-containing protein [Psychromarinibacter halotolerans]
MPVTPTILRPLAFVLGAATATGGGAAQSDTAAALFRPLDSATPNLDVYRWDKRVVLLFAEDDLDPTLATARARLAAAAAGLAERDIVVLTDTNPGAGGAIRSGLGVGGFAMVLVGKDGTVKLNRSAFIDVDELFGVIDAMPMRRREMQDG